jgi:succinoglycan biosynthesis protein ExoV
MILYRWQGPAPNFGDELNTILWPALLPDFFDDDPSVRFLGIGSVLDSRHHDSAVKLVAGAGYGGYEPIPRLSQDWIFHWVRGPMTARLLHLPESLAAGDPATLVPKLGTTPDPAATAIGFMPHFQTIMSGPWPAIAAMAGVTLLDPREPPAKVLARICQCRIVLSEALHGIIVADALRIPWIAIRPTSPAHRPKWTDWAEGMGLHPRFQPVMPSGFGEWAGRLRRWHRNDLAERTAAALYAACVVEPCLSGDTTIRLAQERMLACLDTLRRRPFDGLVRHADRPARPGDLRRGRGIA